MKQMFLIRLLLFDRPHLRPIFLTRSLSFTDHGRISWHRVSQMGVCIGIGQAFCVTLVIQFLSTGCLIKATCLPQHECMWIVMDSVKENLQIGSTQLTLAPMKSPSWLPVLSIRAIVVNSWRALFVAHVMMNVNQTSQISLNHFTQLLGLQYCHKNLRLFHWHIDNMRACH